MSASNPRLKFDGQRLTWRGQDKGRFKATTGMRGYQFPKYQCVKNNGPVPEGVYYISLIMGSAAEPDGSGQCSLKPSWRIEEIPRGEEAGRCERYWANWGHNRVRFEPANAQTKKACSPKRGGFYLHDSTKGYSHGCIEIEGAFFETLRKYAEDHPRQKLYMEVDYKDGRKTNGGTKNP